MPFRVIVRIAFATTSALAVQIARAITEDVSFAWVTASTRLRRNGTRMSISLQIVRHWKILRPLTFTVTEDRMLPARHGAGISPGMNSSDLAYHTLRAKILEGLFKPGSLLEERELCEQPSVSRTPIREALRRLSADGLVEVRPHRSIIVGGRRLPNRAAPLLGADSDAILGEFGYVADEIAALRSSGLV